MTVWYIERDNVVRLAHYLVDHDGAGVPQLLHLIEKPWHYVDTYDEMVAAEEQEEALS